MLASPSSRERAASEDPAQERSLWQGIALNFAQTRDAYRIYVEWRDTGTPPEVAADLKVSEPMQGYKDYLRAQTALREIVASGEIEQLRAYLTNQTQGGFWIPARANDVKGPTVADAVKQGL
ncbi:hypothetical protein JT358_16000 [Micrococcales bacterium 31B]|nr:hypothetical protein [Micrococcales bacterium 31B]